MAEINVLRIAAARELFRSGEAREIRENAGLSQVEMAEALGVSPSAYCLWEAGQRSPRRDAAGRALALLNALRERKPVTAA